MGTVKSLAFPPEQPHKIYFQEEHLVVYWQRRSSNGGLYLGYNMATGRWYPNLTKIETLRRWYDATEAFRLRTAAGLDERPRREGLKSEREIGELARLARPWITRPWGVAA